MAGTKKTIRFDETLLNDALFVADYQEKTFAAYVRYCVKIETQRRLKEKIKASSEEVHAIDIINAIRQAGSMSEGNSALRQLIRKIIDEEIIGNMTVERIDRQENDSGNEEDS